MLKAEEIKQRVDIYDLAVHLGLQQPGGKGNFKSPHHKDSTPSLTLYADGGWKDWSSDEGGSVIDLVMYVHGMDFMEAMDYLHDLYGWDKERKPDTRTPAQKSLAENIADQCLKNDTTPAMEYLTGRGITENVVAHAIKRKAIAWNTWCSDKVEAGQPGYGGPGVSFIVRTMNPGRVVAVDTRYLNVELNGGRKTSAQGEKLGAPWFTDLHRLKKAHTVYVVESPINALSVESCGMKGVAAIATRGANAIPHIDWCVLQGKSVIAAFDHDQPNQFGKRPGLTAAWSLFDQLTALNISCQFVDVETWDEFQFNDLNDILQSDGPAGLKIYLRRLEPWIIPGQPGNHGGEHRDGCTRIFLPPHDNAQYWRYRAKPDFTTYVSKVDKDEDTGVEKMKFDDLCGFRVVAISRINIQSATATMSGDEDTQPLTRFAVTVQIPRYGNKLQRKVFEDERLHNVDHWAKFGPVFARSQFLRMISIMERAADIGARDAVNFVGLAWRAGKPVVNEGPDCYFNEPDKQCPYHNLVFPSGNLPDARAVIQAYQDTYSGNCATFLLVWALGAHLKAYLGSWPHAEIEGSKGSGKSTLVKRLERSIAYTMFSGQSLQTEFRLLTSISHTSHPVGWEEISARRQDVIDKAVSMLQESYQYGVTRRGSDMTEYLQCAPVLLAGEDMPTDTLTGKLVHIDLDHFEKGALIPERMARFPVRQWLQFLADLGQDAVLDIQQKSRAYLLKHCAGDHHDNGAQRMVGNYAGVLTAWKLLCDFARISTKQGDFIPGLVRGMNLHITSTVASREPWIWIIGTLFDEIAARAYRYPHKFIVYRDDDGQHECLLVRPRHVMQQIKTEMRLREIWNGLPVKTDRVLKKQLAAAGVVYRERVDTTINGDRWPHMLALDLTRLADYNLHASPPNDVMEQDSRDIDDGDQPGQGD